MKHQVSSLLLVFFIFGSGYFVDFATATKQRRYDAHDDVPISAPEHLILEQVIMLGRHGNRAPDAEVC